MRTRIVVVAVVSAALALGLFGIPLAFGLAQFASTDERVALQTLAVFTSQAVKPALGHDQIPAELPAAAEGTRLAVYGPDGALLLGDGPASAAEGEDSASELVVTVPVTDPHESLGLVRAATPYTVINRRLVLPWVAMTGLAAVVLVLVWAVARWQARRLARPLEQLAVEARRLGEGDFGVHAARAGIAEIDSVGRALNTTADRLNDLLARERAFSADASHQLRTPLTGLRLKLESAIKLPGVDLRQAITDGIVAADRLDQTIDELLLLARERVGARGEPADLPRLAKQIEEGWGEQLAAAGRSLTVDVARGLPEPRASMAATRQVVAVLMDNAALHGAGTVRVAMRETPEALAVDVADDGEGIAPDEFAARAEQRFGTGAHGLGLGLARRLAEAEGGRLVLTESSPPVFTLFLAVRRH